jgi:hypothetical protein
MQIWIWFIWLFLLLWHACCLQFLPLSMAGVITNTANKHKAQGYQDVTPLGYDNLSCNDAQGAKAGYAFEATNANGARVILTACKRQALWSPVGGWYIVTR